MVLEATAKSEPTRNHDSQREHLGSFEDAVWGCKHLLDTANLPKGLQVPSSDPAERKQMEFPISEQGLLVCTDRNILRPCHPVFEKRGMLDASEVSA